MYCDLSFIMRLYKEEIYFFSSKQASGKIIFLIICLLHKEILENNYIRYSPIRVFSSVDNC